MANAIAANGLRKRFGHATALDGLDLTVRDGEVHAFLGPNGAGKTTTIRILLGLLRRDGGEVSLLGGDPWRDATTLHSRLAYVPGDVTLWPGLTGGEIIFEILGGIVLTLFVTFFLLKDGERIWAWLTRAFGAEGSQRADRAGRAAWRSVVFYVRGTLLVAAIHSIVIGSTLTIMGVPLVAPLAVLVFLGAFIPLVGILLAGALVILITLAAKGWLAALIVLCVFIAEDQLESHLLQPLVVGRIVRLHPLAIILVLAVGGVMAGIPGAVVAVPVAAAVTRAVPELRRRYPLAGPVPGRGDRGPAPPGPR